MKIKMNSQNLGIYPQAEMNFPFLNGVLLSP